MSAKASVRTVVKPMGLFVFNPGDVDLGDVPCLMSYSMWEERDLGKGYLLLDGIKKVPKAWVFYEKAKADRFLKRVLRQGIEQSIVKILEETKRIADFRETLASV